LIALHWSTTDVVFWFEPDADAAARSTSWTPRSSRDSMSATGRRERSRATRTTCRRCLAFRRDDELAGDALALARAEGTSLNEAVKQALKEAVERRHTVPPRAR